MLVELQSVAEELDRVPVRSVASTSFQVADAPHTEAGTLGKDFLGQPTGDTVVAEKISEPGAIRSRWPCIHS